MDVFALVQLFLSCFCNSYANPQKLVFVSCCIGRKVVYGLRRRYVMYFNILFNVTMLCIYNVFFFVLEPKTGWDFGPNSKGIYCEYNQISVRLTCAYVRPLCVD